MKMQAILTPYLSLRRNFVRTEQANFGPDFSHIARPRRTVAASTRDLRGANVCFVSSPNIGIGRRHFEPRAEPEAWSLLAASSRSRS